MNKFRELVQHFKDSEWLIDEKDIKFIKKLGDGASGVTHLAEYEGEKVAVKMYSAGILNNDLNSVKNEMDILSQMRHRNIVSFRGLCLKQDPPSAALVTKFEEKGELGDALYSTRLVRRKGDALRFKIVIGLAEGLKYLHSHHVMHRDIKPANILLNEDLEAMLTDFGFSRFRDESGENPTGETGSYRYMAPEVTSHSNYTEKADVYSFALICNEIFCDERPFEFQLAVRVAVDVVKKNLRPSQKKIKNEKLKAIIIKCWDKDPDARPDWDEVIEELQVAQKEMTKKSTSGLASLFRKKGASASDTST